MYFVVICFPVYKIKRIFIILSNKVKIGTSVMYDAQQAIVFLFTVKYDVPSCKENLVIYVD
jgi:hypothetical protein